MTAEQKKRFWDEWTDSDKSQHQSFEDYLITEIIALRSQQPLRSEAFTDEVAKQDDERIVKDAVVQANENAPEGWVGCLIQVSEEKTWGIQGWIQIPKQGSAYIRLTWEQMDYVGQAVLIHQESE